MAWRKAAITDGEIDALHRAALAACNDDTRYPLLRGSAHHGRGECLNIAQWLVGRLGGHVGRTHGHYVWLSPDADYYLDLTGAHHGHAIYERNTTYRPVPAADPQARAARFIKRADRIFEGLPHLIRLGLDYAGEAYPAETPQAESDRDQFNDSWNDPEQYWHDEADPTTPEGVYQFVYANGSLDVSPNHSHAELSEQAGIDPAGHTGPFAAGHVVITNGRATWEVQANINLHAFLKILKDATKNYGWQWGGMTDAQGQPIIDDFGPKTTHITFHYVYANDHLVLGRTSAADLALYAGDAETDRDVRPLTGTITTTGARAYVAPVYLPALPALFEWAADAGLTLYAGNDNVIKTIEDPQDKNLYAPNPLAPQNPVEPSAPDERSPSGLYSCPTCQRLFPNWYEYSKHRRDGPCAEWADRDDPDANGDNGALPQPDPGLYGDGAHFTEQRQQPGITTGSLSGTIAILPARTWREAARVDGFMTYAQAFAFDNDDYSFYVAYRDGDPLGYAAVSPTGNVQMVHAAIENQGVAKALYGAIVKDYDELSSHAAHEKTATILRRYGWVQSKGQLYRWSKDKAPTDLLDAPLPFIYDVDKDTISVGHPGARTSDIPGKFTPGGIVEGMYEPGGKVVIRSMTSIPYTVRHMVELWYYTHPQMEVKSVHLTDDAGKDTRLASDSPIALVEAGQHIRVLASIDPAAFRASQALIKASGEVYIVGGAIRDTLLHRPVHDIDLLVTGLTEAQVETTLRAQHGHLAHEGKDFKVFHFTFMDSTVQIALPRAERSTGPRHQDFDVQSDPQMPVEQDLRRRDYTANAMAINIRSGPLLDPFGGHADIKAGVLRTITTSSLSDDPLRLIRGLVAHARYGLTPDAQTRAQMLSNAGGLEALPGERIQWELTKLMEAADPAAGIRLAHEVGALKYILPEVDACFGYDQHNLHHELELGDHLLSVLARVAVESADPDLRLAALLHDIGKPGSAWSDPETGQNHYYAKHTADGILGADHEALGAELAYRRLTALHYPNDRIARIEALIAHHMFAGFTTTAGARRFLARVGDHAEDLFLLRWADQGGKNVQPHQATDKAWDVSRNRRLVAKVREAGEAFDRSGLAISGRELIEAGIPPGPQMGQILTRLTARVIDDPDLNQPVTLLRLAQSFATLGDADGPEEPHTEGSGGQAQARPDQARRAVLGQDAQGEPQAPLEPGWLDPEPAFPELPDAQAAHAAAMTQYGEQPYHIRDQGALESALGAPQNHYWGMFGQIDSQASPDPHERLLEAAAKMGYGIGESQPFVNGNKRTARALVEQFLQSNELPHVTPGHDDEEYADHLRGYGVRLCPQDQTQLDANGACPTCGQTPADGGQQRHTLQQTIDMFKQRHHNGGPDLNYASPYPDDDTDF